MENETKDKQKYIDAWLSYIEHLYLLAFTPSDDLSQDVKYTLDKLKKLVEKVADDKEMK